MKIEKLGAKAAAGSAIILFVVMITTFVDNRYALASDLDKVYEIVIAGQIGDLEFRIAEVEVQIAILEGKQSMTEVERTLLSAFRQRRDRYIRDLAALRNR